MGMRDALQCLGDRLRFLLGMRIFPSASLEWLRAQHKAERLALLVELRRVCPVTFILMVLTFPSRFCKLLAIITLRELLARASTDKIGISDLSSPPAQLQKG